MYFDEVVLNDGFFAGQNKVNCAAPFSYGRKVVYGTDDGVYISDLREAGREPVKVLTLLEVSQVDVLEEYQLLIVLSGKCIFFSFTVFVHLNHLDVYGRTTSDNIPTRRA